MNFSPTTHSLLEDQLELEAALTLASPVKHIRPDADEPEEELERHPEVSSLELSDALMRLPPEDRGELLDQLAADSQAQSIAVPAEQATLAELVILGGGPLGELDSLTSLDLEVAATRSAAGKPLDPLEALDWEISQEARAKKQLADARKTLRENGDTLSKAGREALRARILGWETDAEWQPQFAVAVVEVQLCSRCGRESQSALGLWEVQRNNKSNRPEQSPVTRWVKWTPQALPAGNGGFDKLPRRVSFHRVEVAHCAGCYAAEGFLEELPCQL